MGEKKILAAALLGPAPGLSCRKNKTPIEVNLRKQYSRAAL